MAEQKGRTKMGEEKAGGAARGKAQPVQRLVIDRSRWLRGGEDSYLLRDKDRKMCCLGFYGLACGVPAAAMRNITSPKYAGGEWPSWLLTAHGDNSDPCRELMNENDCRASEARIKEGFAEHGVEVVFTDAEASTASAPKEPTDPPEGPEAQR